MKIKEQAEKSGRMERRGWLNFVQATLVGGVAFLLPFGIILVVGDRLVQFVAPAVDKLDAVLFPAAGGKFAALSLALALLILIAFGAGLVARSRLGRTVFRKLESEIHARFPPYALMRDSITDLAGGKDQLAGTESQKVVAIRLDDQTVLGIIKEQLPDQRSVVYLPGAPSALSGTIAIVDDSRLSPLNLTGGDVLKYMRRLGVGLSDTAEPS